MTKKVRAKLDWIAVELGGRKTIIVGDNLKYCPIIKYDNEELDREAWSVFIDCSTFVDKNTTEITMTYFSAEAPFEKLQIGRKFAILEGPKMVAKGIITEIVATTQGGGELCAK